MASSTTGTSSKRGPYKRYLTDPTYPIPRQTRYNWRQCAEFEDSAHSSTQPVPALAPEVSVESEDEGGCDEGSEGDSGDEANLHSDSSSDFETELDACGTEAEDIDEVSSIPQSSPAHLLYEGAQIGEEMGMWQILSLAAKHKLTHSALADILQVICMHLPANGVPAAYRSVYKLLKAVSTSGPDHGTKTVHRLCGKCMAYLPEDRQCQSSSCQALDKPNVKDEVFVEIPVDAQVKGFFESDVSFNTLLLGRFQRLPDDGYITDISDGQEYRKHMGVGGFLSDRMNISLTMNIDGAQVFKSSSMSLWPVYFVINELPASLRFTRKYTILAGLWCSQGSPPMFQYLKPIFERCKLLQTQGTEVPVGEERRMMTCKAMVLCATVDLPAKAKLQHFHQYNGEYGCSVCTHQGKVVAVGSGTTRVYEYQNPPAPLRSHKQSYALGKTALRTQKTCLGVKGLSVLYILPSFDIINGVVIDYMHCVLEGIGKKLCSLWFTHSSNTYYIGRHADLVDKRLLSIKPPDTVARVPRGVTNRKHWKASEYRAWILFYCLPVLKGILPSEHIEHLALLVCSMHILLSDRIHTDSLSLAQQLLDQFYHRFEQLYGLTCCTMNVHLLCHLTHYVRLYGPLWSHSCFHFESLNGQLLRLRHGTHHVCLQLQAEWCLMKRVAAAESSISSLHVSESARQLLRHLNGYTMHANREPLFENCSSVGKKWRGRLENGALSAVNQLLNTNDIPAIDPQHEVCFFGRIILHGVMYHSTKYQKAVKRNNCIVQWSDKIGEVQYFLTLATEAGNQGILTHLAMLSQLTPTPSSSCLSHITSQQRDLTDKAIVPVQKIPQYIAVPISLIHRKCVLVAIEGDHSYVCMVPNTQERDNI